MERANAPAKNTACAALASVATSTAVLFALQGVGASVVTEREGRAALTLAGEASLETGALVVCLTDSSTLAGQADESQDKEEEPQSFSCHFLLDRSREFCSQHSVFVSVSLDLWCG